MGGSPIKNARRGVLKNLEGFIRVLFFPRASARIYIVLFWLCRVEVREEAGRVYFDVSWDVLQRALQGP